MKKLFYFGCIGQTGHHLWSSVQSSAVGSCDTYLRRHGVTNVTYQFAGSLDGTYVPAGGVQGVYKVSSVPPFLIVAWTDRTVDSRPGSHSTFLGVGYTTAEELLADARIQFPSVLGRQTAPLRPEGTEQQRSEVMKDTKTECDELKQQLAAAKIRISELENYCGTLELRRNELKAKLQLSEESDGRRVAEIAELEKDKARSSFNRG